MKPLKLIATIILRIILISAALVFFFSLSAEMYSKSSATDIKIGICDQDNSSLSRSIIHNIRASQYFQISENAVSYKEIQKMIDAGKIDVGVVIPYGTYKDVINKHSVNILAAINGTANPGVSKTALMMLNKIIMTMDNQLMMKVRVDDLGSIPNVRHAKMPPLMVSERVFYNPSFSMEAPMLPAFMGLAMQIVSMLIVLFGILANLKIMQAKFKHLTAARQMPVKAIIPPFIISWIIVGTSITTAFFSTMYLFGVPFTQHTIVEVTKIIFLFVLAMESISFFLVLNIKNGAILAGIITLIVMPAFMYSGFLVPPEQMPNLPNMIGGYFPLRYYLQALYPVFNRHQEITTVYHHLNQLWKFTGLFLGLSVISIAVGRIEAKVKMKKIKEVSQDNE
ncbi:MAG: ABC transporter permease [Bacteroidales bacterium]|nr:ABC transporter permease [Bacteroidales bacterium]